MHAKDLEARATTVEWYPPFTNLGAEMYGAGEVLRRYARYPRWLPVWVEATHSTSQNYVPSVRDLGTFYSQSLVYVKRYKSIFDQYSKTKCHFIPCPFVLYRLLTGVTLAPDQQGTLAFYSHSMVIKDVDVDFEAYIENLKSLPEERQPVTVCLHYIDVQKGVHKKILARGIDCVTFGHATSRDFVARFYETARNFKYAMCNDWTSALLYCADFGLPVSVYGPTAYYTMRTINYSTTASASIEWYTKLYDKYWPLLISQLGAEDREFATAAERQQWQIKEHARVTDLQAGNTVRRCAAIFSGLNDEITPEQQAFVHQELGREATISRAKLGWILYSALIRTPVNLIFRLLRDRDERQLVSKMAYQKIRRDWLKLYSTPNN